MTTPQPEKIMIEKSVISKLLSSKYRKLLKVKKDSTSYPFDGYDSSRGQLSLILEISDELHLDIKLPKGHCSEER